MTAISTPYLGMPGNMQQLPQWNGDLDAPRSRIVSTATLLSGGTAVHKRLNRKGQWSIPYVSWPEQPVSDTLAGFEAGLFGAGPFVFVDPSVRNVLKLDVSSCGVRSQASPGWVASGGTLAVDLSQVSPVAGSAALKWTTSASASLMPGSVANTADVGSASSPGTAPVYLSGESVTASLYAKRSGATSGSNFLQLQGFDVNGAATGSPVQAVIALSTSFQRFTVTAAPGALAGAVYVLPQVLLSSSPPTSVWVAAAQLEYGSAATGWQPGYGSPRVVLSADPGRSSWMYGYSNSTLALAEI